MSNYIDYMANFSQSDLRGYLGEDMVDLLVEWMPNGDTLLVRHMPKKGEHSREAKELVTEIIARLEDIPDGCAECFPFELIDELKQEYLTDNSL